MQAAVDLLLDLPQITLVLNILAVGEQEGVIAAGRGDTGTFAVSPDVLDPDGVNVVAVRARDRGSLGYLDVHMSAEVAEELNISKHTVNTHRRSILHRTGFKNTQKLVLTIISYGSQIQWH